MNKENKIKLSVIVLVYNTAEFLHECFNSLLGQTLDSIEIIVIDDESSDNSLEICYEYEKKYDNFRVITQKNQGGAVAATVGMKLAKGKYVAIIDSDDYVARDGYKKLYDLCEKNNADMSIGRPLRILNGNTFPLAQVEEKAVWEKDCVIESYKEVDTLLYDPFYWNKIFKKEFIEKYDIYMPAGYLYADFLMTHKAYFYAKKIAITNSVVYFWRARPSQTNKQSILQQRFTIDSYLERIRSLEYTYEYFSKKNDSDFFYKIMNLSLYRITLIFPHISKSIELQKKFPKITSEYLQKIDNLSEFSLSPRNKFLLWLLKHGHTNLFLCSLCQNAIGELKEDEYSIYHALPYFEDQVLNIPKQIFKINNFIPALMKNFLYTEEKDKFIFQILIKSSQKLINTEYTLYFKDKNEKTKLSYRLQKNDNYYSCIVYKDNLFSKNERLYISIGNSSNIIYPISIKMCEPKFDTSVKLSYIMNFIQKKKGGKLFVQKRYFSTFLDKAISLIFKYFDYGKVEKYLYEISPKIFYFISKSLKKGIPKSYSEAVVNYAVNDKQVFFESDLGKRYSGNPKAIYEYMLEKYPDYTFIWSSIVDEDNMLVLQHLPGNPLILERASPQYYEELAKSKYCVNNFFFPIWNLRNESKYIQTWHGTPFKKLALDKIGQTKSKRFSNFAYVKSRGWNYLLSPNHYSVSKFNSAFSYPVKRIVTCGYPANDIFYDKNKYSNVRKKVRQELNISDNQLVYLYAPTWRDNNHIGNWMHSFDILFDPKKFVKCDKNNKSVLLLRMHHMSVLPEGIENSALVKNVSDYHDVHELMVASDILITDYSSITFDWLSSKKPMIFFTPDYDQYIKETRGAYFDLKKESPFNLIMTEDNLYKLIKGISTNGINSIIMDKSKLQGWYKKFSHAEDGKAAKRVVDLLLEN